MMRSHKHPRGRRLKQPVPHDEGAAAQRSRRPIRPSSDSAPTVPPQILLLRTFLGRIHARNWPAPILKSRVRLAPPVRAWSFALRARLKIPTASFSSAIPATTSSGPMQPVLRSSNERCPYPQRAPVPREALLPVAPSVTATSAVSAHLHASPDLRVSHVSLVHTCAYERFCREVGALGARLHRRKGRWAGCSGWTIA